MAPLTRLLRPLRGANLEVLKFGIYLLFPITWMYYFGTNLDSRFSVPDFWPTQEQSHTIPFERDEIRKEVERIRGEMKRRKEQTENQNGRILEEMRERGVGFAAQKGDGVEVGRQEQ